MQHMILDWILDLQKKEKKKLLKDIMDELGKSEGGM